MPYCTSRLERDHVNLNAVLMSLMIKYHNLSNINQSEH
jgi:hypothetical protein